MPTMSSEVPKVFLDASYHQVGKSLTEKAGTAADNYLYFYFSLLRATSMIIAQRGVSLRDRILKGRRFAKRLERQGEI